MWTKEVHGKIRLRARLAALALLLFSLLLGACSSAKSEDMSVAPKMGMQDQYGGTVESPSDAEANSGMANSVQTTSDGAPAAQASSGSAEAGAGSGAASGGGIAPISDPGTGMARKVIYKANVTMKVEAFDAADQQLRDVIHLSGSYILQFSNTVDTSGKGATYVIKVPADGFSDFIDRLRQIEKDLQLQLEGSDVTEEYVDLNARLKAKQTVEARLLSFMDKATDSDDLVRFSSELAAVQEQIEQIKGRMRYLDQNVAYSTVNVRLYEGAEFAKAEEKEDPFGERLVGALTSSAKTLGQFGQALLIFLAALLPVAAVAAAIGVPVYFILRASRRARREAAAERRKQWNGVLPGTGGNPPAGDLPGTGGIPPAGSIPDQDGPQPMENALQTEQKNPDEGNNPPQKESD